MGLALIVTVDRVARVATVTVRGELESRTYSRLQNRLLWAAESCPRRLVLDLDVYGRFTDQLVNLITTARRQLPADCLLEVRSANPAVQNVLKLRPGRSGHEGASRSTAPADSSYRRPSCTRPRPGRRDQRSGRARRPAVKSATRLSSQPPGVLGCPLTRLVPPGQTARPAREVSQVPGLRSPLMINGVPVVSAPADIDVITAEKLRMVLLETAADGYATVVMDLTGTQFCDSYGLQVMATAHQRALDRGGQRRLVFPAGSPVLRILTLTSLDEFFPCFTRLDQALASPMPAVITPWRPHRWYQPPGTGRLSG